MNHQAKHAPVLVFTCGNPSRGDDALGAIIYDQLEHYLHETSGLDRVDLLADYQLQIEHTIDLEQRQAILFIDASVSCAAPYEFYKLQAERDDSYTTHAMSPAALLAVYEQVNKQSTAPAYMCSIRGYEFVLGTALSAQANTNLQQAGSFVKRLLGINIENWADIQVR